MKLYADLHLHSKHSRGCSKDLTLENLEKYARFKGIDVLGTGDFTHPIWNKELKAKLTDTGEGIYQTTSGFNFMLTTEISLIYSQGGKSRRIHNVVLAPSLDVVDQIIEYLSKHGRLDYDGRPIFGIPCPEFVGELRAIDKTIEVIPAHIWTPWFSLFGSKSGFDSVQECFEDQTRHIHALETGLSSDPAMNWRVSQLDKYTLVSFSDAHSYWPWRVGRELTQFDVHKLSYKHMLHGLRSGEGVSETIEFWPDEGKYHLDGHRNCNVCMHPRESTKNNDICPVCKRPMTIGVLHRVEELSDREPGYQLKGAHGFRNLIPLAECIAGAFGMGVNTKKVWGLYSKLIEQFGTEMEIVLNTPIEQITKVDENVACVVQKNREERIPFTPGYDGIYGKPDFGVTNKKSTQLRLDRIGEQGN